MSDSKIRQSDLDLVDPDMLPPQIRHFVRIIGIAKTYTLLLKKGGLPYRFPKSPENTELALIVGMESARKLCQAFGDQRTDLPKVDKVLLQIRDIALRNARSNASASEVARQFNLTRRHVFGICSEEPDDQNLDLFS